MFELAPLAASAVTLITPLLSKALDKGVEEIGKSAATGILGKIKSTLSHAGAKEALEDLSKQPTSSDFQGALRVQLIKAMQADPELAKQVMDWLDESKPKAEAAGINMTANTQGDHNTVIQVSGSGHTIQR